MEFSAADFEGLLMFEHALKASEAQYINDPLDSENLLKWGGALLELCQFQSVPDAKQMLNDAISKLEEALTLNPLWCLGNAYASQAFLSHTQNYIKNRLGEWGDHITLQAAADRFAAKICLLTSFRDTCFIEIIPQYKAPKRELWLSFWSEVHYNSLYDNQAAPIQHKPKRKHWLF